MFISTILNEVKKQYPHLSYVHKRNIVNRQSKELSDFDDRLKAILCAVISQLAPRSTLSNCKHGHLCSKCIWSWNLSLNPALDIDCMS